MTFFRLPKPNLGDRILNLFGKKRAVFIASKERDQFGRYASMEAEKENFWKALFHPEGKKLKDGWVYPEELLPDRESGSKP